MKILKKITAVSAVALMACAARAASGPTGSTPIPQDPATQSGITISSQKQYRSITCIAEDSQGLIWFGTGGNGLFRYDGTNYIRYSTNGEGCGLQSKHINSIFTDSKGRMWVATQKGIHLFNSSENIFTTVRIDDVNNFVSSVFEDKSGHILAISQTGVLIYDPEEDIFRKSVSLKDNTLLTVICEDNGTYSLVYDSFIDLYDKDFHFIDSCPAPSLVTRAVEKGAGSILLYTKNGFSEFDSENAAYIPAPETLKTLDGKNIWLIRKYGASAVIIVADGIHYFYNFVNDKLITSDDPSFPYDAPDTKTYVSEIIKGKSGSVWAIATSNAILNLTSPDTSPYRLLCKEISSISVHEIFSDGQTLRFTSQAGELISYDIGTKVIRRQQIADVVGDRSPRQYSSYWTESARGFFIYTDNKIFELEENGTGLFSLKHTYTAPSGHSITSIAVDRRNTVWASCQNTTSLFSAPLNSESRDITLSETRIDPGTSRVYISKLLTLSNGTIAIGFTDIGLGIFNPATKEVSFARLSTKYTQMYIYKMCEDSDGDIWIGTTDIGLIKYSPSEGTATHLSQFGDAYISCITRDTQKHILFAADNTIWSYDPQTASFKRLWRIENNTSLSSVRIFALNGDNLIINANGKLIPTDWWSIFHQPIPTHFSIVLSDDKSNILKYYDKKDFEAGSVRITLPPNQNSLELSFFTPKFNDQPILFNYRLKRKSGFVTSFDKPVINLSNLSYGNHTVQLRITDLEGSATSDIETVTIHIQRPWYLSTVAAVFYALLFLAAIFTIMRQWVQIKKKKIEADSIRREKELQEQLDNENIDFFANMSHELRTPLSIIAAASDTLTKEEPHTSSQLKLQKIIQRNSDRMLKLVSQMLDFNKLEHNKLPLTVTHTEIKPIISEIAGSFTPAASQKEIKLSIIEPEDPIVTWLDEDKFEKIIYNLLSNAIKFTPVHGFIFVKYYSTDHVEEIFTDKADIASGSPYLVVEIADTGIGIPEDSLDLVFERFGQAFPSQKESGTGIGLYFAKAMVELHHGFIKASNKEGAVITLALPMSSDAYTDYEKKAKTDRRQSIDRKNYLSEYTLHNDPPKQDTETTVLVIDDDYEVINFLTTMLSPLYRVITSFDAMGGYKMIEEQNPDIIISDIMMAEMDGLQLCRQIKDNINICHIPLILLTAKDTVASQIEGLNSGADAYIVKPFVPDYLLAMIGTLLRNRENVKQLLNSRTEVDKTLEESISGKDRELMEKIYQLFEKNLSNYEINAADFADECGISRTKFFYKVKSLTGITPADYFRTYRLNRAAELLKSGKYKIAAIASMCGFSSPSHFSSSFKKQFGILPSEYPSTPKL